MSNKGGKKGGWEGGRREEVREREKNVVLAYYIYNHMDLFYLLSTHVLFIEQIL